ncbi:MAG: AbrB/MazE/SpoVT family DNA-binding domain-containing protein [Acidobacteriota bacterium]
MKSVISERGQVTIPKKIRDDLGLEPGHELDFEIKDSVIICRKRVRGMDPVSAVAGIVPKIDVDSALEELRGPAWRKELDENGD